MRGWVGVKILGEQKMAEIISIQGFHDFYPTHPPAHFTQQEFQPFYPLTQFLKWTMIISSAQLNLENYIYIGFQPPAIAISITPY
jgi:hypothetical protein